MILSSPDGSHWTNRVFNSAEGTQWTPTFSADNDSRGLADIVYANGLFVAVGKGNRVKSILLTNRRWPGIVGVWQDRGELRWVVSCHKPEKVGRGGSTGPMRIGGAGGTEVRSAFSKDAA